jgi:hypothetical protein
VIAAADTLLDKLATMDYELEGQGAPLQRTLCSHKSSRGS